jgi:hypothetical protein
MVFVHKERRNSPEIRTIASKTIGIKKSKFDF